MAKLHSDCSRQRNVNMITLGNIDCIVKAGIQTNVFSYDNCQLNGELAHRTDDDNEDLSRTEMDNW